MKRLIYILFFACALIIQLNAQTPFDSFAPEATRPMLGLEESTNTTSDSILCAIVADVQNQMLLLVDVSTAKIVAATPITDDIRKWLSVDPLADNYPGISPYAYCLWNPIKNIDPDGRSTKVVRNDDDTYTVFGGDLNDGDLHIYEYTKDKDGNLIKGNSIGVSTSTTSFSTSLCRRIEQ